jgi:hypothetical protein
MIHLLPAVRRARILSTFTVLPLATTVLQSTVVRAQNGPNVFFPGNLVVSRSLYLENPALGLYPYVWNNALANSSFGITSKIFLDQMTLIGLPINSVEVPNSTQNGVPPTKDQMVTSFSSKSEIALNLSTDGSIITFMGYLAPVNALEVSNANTPLVIDPTNPVDVIARRLVATVDAKGKFRFTATNAYSGNNGRAAILNNANGANAIFTAGNAGNGSNPQPFGVVIGAGAQIMAPQVRALQGQQDALPTPVGSFSVTLLGAKPDKIGKDDNFRGIAVFNDVLYYTKGSGGNGVNTVYFVDTSGQACPNGVGLPAPDAPLPNAPLPYDPADVAVNGLPSNMCILKGFPKTLNSKLTSLTTAYPFGIWFADAKTLYVADEGSPNYGDVGLTPAGLQKWVFDDQISHSWKMVYALQTGLGIGQTYHFPGDAAYPQGVNAATGLPWAPLTGGIRNITGHVNGDGTVTIWGVTSTVSGNGDQGADPNKLVAITDILANQNPLVAKLESFVTVRTAGFREVLRGVSFTPGSSNP